MEGISFWKYDSLGVRKTLQIKTGLMLIYC